MMLTEDSIKYLMGLARVDARKRERSLAKAKPYPGQDPESFRAFTADLASKRRFTERVLEQLKIEQRRVRILEALKDE